MGYHGSVHHHFVDALCKGAIHLKIVIDAVNPDFSTLPAYATGKALLYSKRP